MCPCKNKVLKALALLGAIYTCVSIHHRTIQVYPSKSINTQIKLLPSLNGIEDTTVIYIKKTGDKIVIQCFNSIVITSFNALIQSSSRHSMLVPWEVASAICRQDKSGIETPASTLRAIASLKLSDSSKRRNQ